MKFVRLTSAITDHPIVVFVEQIEAITVGGGLTTQIELCSGRHIPVREMPEEIVKLPVEEMKDLAQHQAASVRAEPVKV